MDRIARAHQWHNKTKKQNGLAKEKYCIHCKKTTLINEDSGGKQTCSQCGKEYTN
jgi:ribosomal protein L33